MNMTMNNKNVTTNKRGKLGITRGQAFIFLLAFACFFYLLGGFVFASETKTEPTYKLVTVQPGDSLWKLAVRHHDNAGMEIEEMIDALAVMNGLKDATIYPGQNMKIPLQQ